MSDENIDLKAKFPDMEPIKNAPSMFTLNGFGLKIYGRRDEDRETRTYVTSRCICAIFIPIFWLDAYRVHPAGGNSYYFLGRHPLSGACKLWNMLVISIGCVFGGYAYWDVHTHSPEYIAARHLDDARALKAAGKYPESLTKLSTVLGMRTSNMAAALAEFDALIADRFDKADAKEATTLLQMVLTHKPPQRNSPAAAEWFKRAEARAKDLASTDARGARQLLKLAEPLATDKATVAALSNEFLAKAVAQNPEDMNLLGEWAAVLESKKDMEGLKKLLEPHKAKLGSTEGARMLGQIYAHDGDNEASYALLEPYMRGRLDALHAAEQQYEALAKQVSDNALASLRKGTAGDAWYRQYESASEPKKQELVDKYIYDSMRNNGSLQNAEKVVAKEAKVVPVALDFGIVRLQRAQGMTDAAAKKKELEAAEKVFLAIRGTAGETDSYLLYYGQVLFWLGRAEEGQKEFDQLLTKNKRDPGLLMTLANVYRELGDINATLKMMEECYTSSKDPKMQQGAAGMRAIVSQTLEDKILWLGRADASRPHIRAELCEAMGEKAMRDGDRVQAAAKFREALQFWEGIPRDAATLNNRSVTYAALFGATGDRADYRRAVELQVESLGLDPKDTILMLNTANSLTQNAGLDIFGPSIDFMHAGTTPTIGNIGHLYSDDATRESVARKVAANKDIVQAASILERLLLLSPRSENAYSILSRIYSACDNTNGLRELRERLKTVVLDTAHSREETLDFIKNGVKPEHVKSTKLLLAKLESNVKELNNQTDPLTRSLALDTLYEQLWALHHAGEQTDFDRFVTLAEEQHKIHPSSDSIRNLTDAYIVRGVMRTAQLRPEWKQQLEKSRRSIPLSKLLPGFLESAGELRARIVADADIQKGISFMRECRKLFPKHPRIHDWKLTQILDPELSAEIGKYLLSDDSHLLHDELFFMLRPYSSTDALDMYWFHQLRGDNAAAEKIKKTLEERGIPWPLK